jgi:phosphatidylserine/phosphatidylglycerophosphate/cardiolipin synthase-like enzyme
MKGLNAGRNIREVWGRIYKPIDDKPNVKLKSGQQQINDKLMRNLKSVTTQLNEQITSVLNNGTPAKVLTRDLLHGFLNFNSQLNNSSLIHPLIPIDFQNLQQIFTAGNQRSIVASFDAHVWLVYGLKTLGLTIEGADGHVDAKRVEELFRLHCGDSATNYIDNNYCATLTVKDNFLIINDDTLAVNKLDFSQKLSKDFQNWTSLVENFKDKCYQCEATNSQLKLSSDITIKFVTNESQQLCKFELAYTTSKSEVIKQYFTLDTPTSGEQFFQQMAKLNCNFNPEPSLNNRNYSATLSQSKLNLPDTALDSVSGDKPKLAARSADSLPLQHAHLLKYVNGRRDRNYLKPQLLNHMRHFINNCADYPQIVQKIFFPKINDKEFYQARLNNRWVKQAITTTTFNAFLTYVEKVNRNDQNPSQLWHPNGKLNQHNFERVALAALQRGGLDAASARLILSYCSDKYSQAYQEPASQPTTSGLQSLPVYSVNTCQQIKNQFDESLKDLALGVYQKAGINLMPVSARVEVDKFTVVQSNPKENQFIDEIKSLFTQAQKSVQLTSLSAPEPGGQYEKVLVESLAQLIAKAAGVEKSVKIQLVFGQLPKLFAQLGITPGYFKPRLYLEYLLKLVRAKLTEKLREQQNKQRKEGRINQGIMEIEKQVNTQLNYLNIEVIGYSNTSLTDLKCSWNHSKIIVVDGEKSNVGGINLFEEYNDPNNRVRDVGINFDNRQVAAYCTDFINTLARQDLKIPKFGTPDNVRAYFNGEKIMVNKRHNRPVTTDTSTATRMDPIMANNEPPEKSNNNSNTKNNVICVGRGYFAQGGDLTTSDAVLLEMINSAQKTLKISQQSIMFMYALGQSQFNRDIIDALRKALLRGVKIDIIVSGENTQANGIDYNGMSATRLRQELWGVDNSNLRIINLLNEQGIISPNHAKVVIKDARMFYVGSHNLYDASHAEYGVVIAGEDHTKKFLKEFWYESLGIKEQSDNNKDESLKKEERSASNNDHFIDKNNLSNGNIDEYVETNDKLVENIKSIIVYS